VTNAFLSANANYVSAQGSLALAQKNLDAAVAKRKALTDPPDPLQLAQLQASVDSATAALAGAQARYDTLMAGPASTDLALAQQSVDLAQVSYQQALDSANGLVLTAPFDGIVGAIPINVGDQVGATTAAMTLTNPDRVRIDLTVTETDFSGLKAGEYGIATFDSLPGQTFLVKITGVSSTPTVAQGVVTYPVQALILRGQDLAASAADLQKVASALASLSGGGLGGFAGGQRGQAANGTPGAQRTPGANGQRTPQAGVTPGQGGFAGGQNGQAGGGGFGAAQAFGNGPLPVTGMTANVIVLLDVKENALLVPNAAVKRQGRTSYVLVPQADGTTRQQTVGVGGSDNTNTEITTGLNEGDKVLVGVTSTTPTAGRTTTTFEGGFGPGGRGPTPAGGVR
jgi:hypothetical protein